jgi:predicted glycosyltransferase
MQALQTLVCSSNVQVRPFLADFPQQLLASALSINMGGDNSVMDVLSTRTPALAYPYQGNSEQGFRIQKFAQQGLLHALAPQDLQPERLRARINQALHAPYPQHQLRMDGARVAAEKILAAAT